MPKKVTVSILMSVYNVEFHYIKRAIDSVLNQTFQDFELIIIDDGSDNESHIELLEYAQKFEDKITYIRHFNRGQSKSINRGVLNSTAPYITILDADDEYKPNHLNACLEAITDFDLIASTTETVVDHEEDYYVTDMENNQLCIHVDDCILFATLFGKKEVFTSLNFNNMYAADAHFYERAEQQFMVQKLDLRTYIYYRNNPNSITAKVKSNTIN
jgi:glycosyltransferase involved in cell wall biosynthesis